MCVHNLWCHLTTVSAWLTLAPGLGLALLGAGCGAQFGVRTVLWGRSCLEAVGSGVGVGLVWAVGAWSASGSCGRPVLAGPALAGLIVTAGLAKATYHFTRTRVDVEAGERSHEDPPLQRTELVRGFTFVAVATVMLCLCLVVPAVVFGIELPNLLSAEAMVGNGSLPCSSVRADCTSSSTLVGCAALGGYGVLVLLQSFFKWYRDIVRLQSSASVCALALLITLLVPVFRDCTTSRWIGVALVAMWLFSRHEYRFFRRSGAPAEVVIEPVDIKDRPPARSLEPESDKTLTQPEPQPLIVVCASGGGSRAGVWSLLVLAALEQAWTDAKNPAPLPVRMVFGASGGMVGMAQWVRARWIEDCRKTETQLRETIAELEKITTEPQNADQHRMLTEQAKTELTQIKTQLSSASLPERRGRMPGQDQESLTHALARTFRETDALAPLLQQLVFSDIPLSPFAILSRCLGKNGPTHRGEAWEECWERANLFNEPEHGHLDALKQAEFKGQIPTLVFSPMMPEDGRRLLISNADLSALTTITGPETKEDELAGNPTEKPGRPEKERRYSHPTLEARGLKPEWPWTLQEAARASATFPFVMPISQLPTKPRRRLVDAGYYDNYGVGLATQWLESKLDEGQLQGTKVLVVQIRDVPSALTRSLHDAMEEEANKQAAWTNWFGFADQLWGPIASLFGFRVAVQLFENDEDLSRVLRRINKLNKLDEADDHATTVSFELRRTDLALSWVLTPEDWDTLDGKPEDRSQGKTEREYIEDRAKQAISWLMTAKAVKQATE